MLNSLFTTRYPWLNISWPLKLNTGYNHQFDSALILSNFLGVLQFYYVAGIEPTSHEPTAQPLEHHRSPKYRKGIHRLSDRVSVRTRFEPLPRTASTPTLLKYCPDLWSSACQMVEQKLVCQRGTVVDTQIRPASLG